jgi:signal peptidase II
MKPKLGALLAVVAVVLPLDQLTKLWVVTNVSPLRAMEIIPGFFRITHARNPGAALGLFQGLPVAVFIVLTLVALGFILSFYRRVPANDRLSGLSLGLIVAGALGNLVDRAFRGGEVVDFLQFDLGLFIFPDFNVADSAIVVGVLLLLLDVVAAEAEQGRGDPARGSAETGDG